MISWQRGLPMLRLVQHDVKRLLTHLSAPQGQQRSNGTAFQYRPVHKHVPRLIVNGEIMAGPAGLGLV